MATVQHVPPFVPGPTIGTASDLNAFLDRVKELDRATRGVYNQSGHGILVELQEDIDLNDSGNVQRCYWDTELESYETIGLIFEAQNLGPSDASTGDVAILSPAQVGLSLPSFQFTAAPAGGGAPAAVGDNVPTITSEAGLVGTSAAALREDTKPGLPLQWNTAVKPEPVSGLEFAAADATPDPNVTAGFRLAIACESSSDMRNATAHDYATLEVVPSVNYYGAQVRIDPDEDNILEVRLAGLFVPEASDHDVLSAVHTDTLTASVVKGDLIIGNATPKWSRLGIGTNGHILTVVAGVPAWAANAGGLPAGASPGDVLVEGLGGPEWASEAPFADYATSAGSADTATTAGSAANADNATAWDGLEIVTPFTDDDSATITGYMTVFDGVNTRYIAFVDPS